MSDNFYRAFEEKHRGSCELIISRLRAYLPFISPLKEIYPTASVTDLGCGRGEWLELLLGEGFLPRGVDQDEGMLQGCLDRNLPAEKGDIIEYLSTLSNESQTIVSAFHVVEHITFDQLRTLVSEALRVLKPGGLLIMETPNPENIAVATRNFYMDPTHQRPIPPQLLLFLPEHYGFFRNKIIRLQESKELLGKISPTLNDVFEGVSPDYAVVAQKASSSEILELFDQAFDQEYGLQLTTLAERYDTAILAKAQQAEIIAQQAEAKAQQAEAKAQQAEAKAQEAKIIAQHTEATITAIYNSRSWQVTYPLRWFASQFRLFRMHGAKNRIKAAARKVAMPMLHKAVNFVNTRPWLRQRLVVIAQKIGIYDKIKSIYHRLQHVSSEAHALGGRNERQLYQSTQLTPRALQIYHDLKTATEKNKEQQ